MINQLQLQASIESFSEQRYTPSGIVALDLVLAHESEQLESGVLRQVRLSIKAVAFDEVVRQLSFAKAQTPYIFKGFLASRGRTKQVVLHITDFQLAQTTVDKQE